MENDVINWLRLADKFAADGDPRGMRACAKELWNLDAASMDGAAVMAEAALYTGDLEEARALVGEILAKKPRHLRARLVKGGIAAQEFRLDEELPLLRELVAELEKKRLVLDDGDAYLATVVQMLKKARGWLADGLYLAAEPAESAENLLAHSELCADASEKAASYSKYLFMSNYRDLALDRSRAMARHYDELLATQPYSHEHNKKQVNKKLRIGYISPDFRNHAVAYFLAPMLKQFNGDKFMVYCYATGRRDEVTRRLQSGPITWRDLRGRPAKTAARLISEDAIDILVDLSGHTQGSALPIMAYKPAPVQVSGIGYTATTGIRAIDYFLSDEVCLPTGDTQAAGGFTEQIIRLPHSHLCYAPGAIREMPESGAEAPCFRNGYVTFGSFNNFAKVTDETLLLWRGILDQVKDSRLVIKGKICSIPSGEDIVRGRLKRLGFDQSRIELRPYSPDYLEQYRDIDIALDAVPYNGGLTTCEALYMGVPVVGLRGRTHGSRFGASILVNADVKELLVENDLSYVRRAVQLGNRPELIGAYHSGLRANMKRSPLMDAKNYMAELESKFSAIWRNFCTI